MFVYRMDSTQSALWNMGCVGKDTVSEAIVEMFQAVECPEDVLVEEDDGSIAFMWEQARGR